jgi:hypothetical protein
MKKKISRLIAGVFVIYVENNKVHYQKVSYLNSRISVTDYTASVETFIIMYPESRNYVL